MSNRFYYFFWGDSCCCCCCYSLTFAAHYNQCVSHVSNRSQHDTVQCWFSLQLPKRHMYKFHDIASHDSRRLHAHINVYILHMRFHHSCHCISLEAAWYKKFVYDGSWTFQKFISWSNLSFNWIRTIFTFKTSLQY